MVHLVPFYKDANFKIKEAPEIIDFVKKKRYDYHKYLECLTETFYRYNPEGKLLLSTDMTTNPVNYQGEYYRQDTSDKTIIQSKVYNETRLICDDNGINENIIMCGTDHLINRKLDKIFLNQDFDIKIPIRKTARVNNAMIVVKKVTDNVKRLQTLIESRGYYPPSGSMFFDTNVHGGGTNSIDSAEIYLLPPDPYTNTSSLKTPYVTKDILWQPDTKISRMFLFVNSDLIPYSSTRKDSLLNTLPINMK